MNQNPTARFSKTAEYYVRYRPTYPAALMDFFRSELNLTASSIIADVGAGTGKLTELFLQNGNRTYAIEPNREMRLAAERLLGSNVHFTSIDGTAENTNLPDQSIDFIAVGTAFHWFEPVATRHEFQRILKPNGYVLLTWNYRNNDRSAFMHEYEDFLLEYSSDYKKVKEAYPDDAILDQFFVENNWQQVIFENLQIFDFEGLKGRYQSCSYALEEDSPQFNNAMDALRLIFERHQQNGKVIHWYHTVLYYGKLE
ncbi:MAG: class I SAM-dependent methyltransferase [Saprospiraceae bacterium]|nr:class I SAM-dependent methyltransferase [Saprospiraceae bacterium]